MNNLQSTPDAYFPNLGWVFQNINRVAFSVFGIEIYWYGIFICIGVMLGIVLLLHNTKGENQDLYIDFAFWGIISGIIGARSYYLIFNDGSLRDFFGFRNGGLAIYGGIIGAVISIVIYAKVKKIKLLKFTDNYAPSLIIGQVLGRLGNFVNREAFGRATKSFFSLMYRADEVSHLKIVDGVGIYRDSAEYPLTIVNDVAYISVHPTFMYEMAWNTAMLIFFMCYRKHKRFDGEISCMYFLFYGIGRFCIESLRTDQLMIGSIPVSMLLSGILIIASLIFYVIMYKRTIKKFN